MPDGVSADALHLRRLILDTPWMRELSVVEQRYQAVLAVISDGLSITQVASKVGVSRQTLHAWLARYEAEGLDGLVDRSHRPVSCPHQMPSQVEAAVLELRRSRSSVRFVAPVLFATEQKTVTHWLPAWMLRMARDSGRHFRS